MFPKKGNSFPGGNDRENGSTNYTAIVATALRKELGGSHRATKTVMRWTGASERTVKHWLAGHHGPGGAHLIALIRESEAMYEAVLTAANRRDALVAARMSAAHATMIEAIAAVQQARSGSPQVGSGSPDRRGDPTGTRLDDPKNVRVNDPIHNRNRESTGLPAEDGLNPRQRWYLEALAAGKDVRADDLRRRWRVSQKTARRDVAALKGRGIIEFVGPPRTGRYRRRA